MEKTNVPPRFATRVGENEQGRAWVWPVTAGLHALAALAIVVVPLLGPEGLPDQSTSVVKAAVPTRTLPKPTSQAFTAPVQVPDSLPAEATLDVGLEGGVPGGVE